MSQEENNFGPLEAGIIDQDQCGYFIDCNPNEPECVDEFIDEIVVFNDKQAMINYIIRYAAIFLYENGDFETDDELEITKFEESINGSWEKFINHESFNDVYRGAWRCPEEWEMNHIDH